MTASILTLPDGRQLPLDEKGYLMNRSDWSPAVAEAMAKADGVVLGADHWVVLELFRTWFDQYEVEPPMRALVRLARERLGETKGSSRYLYQLFPNGPATQACRYAGLPRPVSCI